MRAFYIMPKKIAVKKRLRTPWNTRELLLSVTGYLTTREKPLIFGSDADAAPIAEIIGKIADANNLPQVRRRWKKIHIPDGLENITNVPKVKAVAASNASPADNFIEYLLVLTPEDQNSLIKHLLKTLQDDRRRRLEEAEIERKKLNDEIDRKYRTNEELFKLTGGNSIN